MNKFIENSIKKQDMAYNMEWAKKNFLYSCDMCASRNLLRCDCSVCPITLAYQRAVIEIIQRQRKKPNNGIRTYRDRKGHVTVVIKNSNNVTVNINEK